MCTLLHRRHQNRPDTLPIQHVTPRAITIFSRMFFNVSASWRHPGSFPFQPATPGPGTSQPVCVFLCVGTSAFQAASLIQGQDRDSTVGAAQPSVVTLRMRRGDDSLYTVTLQRPVTEVQSPVTARLVSAGMLTSEPTGLIRLTSFNARAHR